ncbi:MAG TPA: hypothetical protein VH599_06350 [Ktedonobacterales bacterium]
MIEPLRQAIEQVELLDPTLQEEVAGLLQYKLAELEKRAKRQEAIERLYDKWEAELPEQLAALERTPRTYHTDAEFFALLDSLHNGEQR